MPTPHHLFAATRVLLVAAYPADIPPGRVLMNAPRPILGSRLEQADTFMHGSFFATLDLDAPGVDADIVENAESDAWLVVRLPQALLIDLCLHDHPLRHLYDNRSAADQWLGVQNALAQKHGMPYGDLISALELAGLPTDWT